MQGNMTNQGYSSAQGQGYSGAPPQGQGFSNVPPQGQGYSSGGQIYTNVPPGQGYIPPNA